MSDAAAELDSLVQRADLDGLVRHVDATCASREWAHLLRVRDRARAAVDTGRQLWPIATLANHRLALWAPAELAVQALDDSARTFMPGPVSEILAVHHGWDETEPHLAPGHDRSLFAHERSLRGDTVPPDEPSLIDVPFTLQDWEPRYEPAAYDDDGVDAPSPLLPTPDSRLEPRGGQPIDDPETVTAFRVLVEPWTAQSNGSASCTVAEGGLPEALHAAGAGGCDVVRIDHRTGLAVLAWAGASGGAHGRRRGLATGRSNAWWFLAVLTGLHDTWPCDPDELGDVTGQLEWWLWQPHGQPRPGWNVNLVLVDGDEGLS
ncbi:MAG: hypothetical protein ACO36A_08880, partial [Ilumatobacteraceae bacterium]